MPFENACNELVLIPSFKGIKCVAIQKIVFCEAYGNYTKIHQIDGSFTTNLSLKHIEQILPIACFFRCHKSYIINFRFFSELHIAEDVIYLENKSFVKLSKHKKKDFVMQLNAFVEANNAKSSVHP
ncbi:MAG: LytTR family DNA-binding domain-containing protein [Crocinitomicaceae bacterium]